MGRMILVLAIVGVTIYSAIDCIRSDDSEIRGMPKPLWLLVIVALSPMGAVAWLLLGRIRPPADGPGGGGRTPPVVAPDDDPDFLRSLDEKRRNEP
jgi:hypothetical protein